MSCDPARRGYDPKSKYLFEWNRDFRFKGKSESVPDGNAYLAYDDGDMRIGQEIAGCMFLSGCRDSVMVLWMDDMDGEAYGVMGRFRGRAVSARGSIDGMANMASQFSMVCLCGPVVRSPGSVARFCRKFSCCRVYVCDLVDELAAFGALVSHLETEKPRRANLYEKNDEVADGDFVPFNPKLEGDGYGRMADLVKKGMPCFNQMMKGVGLFPFYDRVVSDGTQGSSVYMVSLDEMDAFFPGEPLSAKRYAATSVPVRMANTEGFSKASGWRNEWVDVVASSDFVLGTSTFMKFYKIMSGRGFAGVCKPNEISIVKKKAPVFRYNGAYRAELKEGKFDVERLLQG